jgi:MFS transporter, Spinster family, sphingosine-1-phosphate transporter
MFSALALSCLYFVITGIQYWISDYMLEVLGTSMAYVYTSYSLTSVTGPVVGVICGKRENEFVMTLK